MKGESVRQDKKCRFGPDHRGQAKELEIFFQQRDNMIDMIIALLIVDLEAL